MNSFKLLFFVAIAAPIFSFGQQTDMAGIDKDTVKNFSTYKRSIGFSGLLSKGKIRSWKNMETYLPCTKRSMA